MAVSGTSFKKGRSGNPKGRPSSAKGLSDRLRMLLHRKNKDGKRNDEAFIEKALELALAGNPVAFREIWERIEGKVPQALEGTDKPIAIKLVVGNGKESTDW